MAVRSALLAALLLASPAARGDASAPAPDGWTRCAARLERARADYARASPATPEEAAVRRRDDGSLGFASSYGDGEEFYDYFDARVAAERAPPARRWRRRVHVEPAPPTDQRHRVITWTRAAGGRRATVELICLGVVSSCPADRRWRIFLRLFRAALDACLVR